MYPPSFEYVRAGERCRSCRASRPTWRRRQDPERRPEPDPHDEAAHCQTGVAHRHRPVPDLLISRKTDGYLKNRRPHARSRSGGVGPDPVEIPDLHDTAAVIADPLVRNLATVGGNLAHGDPANDHPATMLALGAEVVATGPKGERVIRIDDFFVSIFHYGAGAR